MKNKEWLKGLINEEAIVMDMNLLGRHDEQYWKNENIKINKGRLFYLIDQLDEPEVLSQEWIDEHKVARIDDLRRMTTRDVVTVEKLQKLLVPKQDELEQTDTNVGLLKVVIPQFVADWIERNKQPDWDYDKKEGALADSIHFTLYSLHTNYRKENPDVVLRKPVNEWLDDDRKNYWKLIDGVRHGYEVEKEPRWVVKIGKGYFSGYDETKVTYVLDNCPGEIARRIVYDDLNEAESDANDIGGEVEEVTK